MAYIPISDVGAHGIVLDRKPHELPLGAWSGGENVRFRDGYVQRSEGDAVIWGTPQTTPIWLLPFFSTTAAWWVYAGTSAIYATDGSSHFNVGSIAYHASLDDKWTGGMFNSIPVINNPVDGPWYMATPTPSSVPFTALPNWPSGVTCRVMRPFKNFLVAMDVTKAGIRYPQMVKWSHQADPGAIPISWDEADARYDTGEFPLADTNGIILDSLPLRDLNVIYKEDSTHLMQYVGGVFVFRFARAFSTIGALATNCAVDVPMVGHVVLSQDDVVMHNGQQAESLVDKRLRRNIFARIDGLQYGRSFVCLNFPQREVWVCIPEIGATVPTLAYVWRWEDNTWSIRELPNAAFIAGGIATSLEGVGVIDADSGIIDSDSTLIDARTFNPTVQRLIGAHNLESRIRQFDSGMQFGGANGMCFIERTGLGVPFKANQPPDLFSMKYLRDLRPRIEGTTGGVVQVSVGSQDNPASSVQWQSPRDFIIGTTQHIDTRCTGRLLAVRYESTGDVDWRLHGHEFDVVPGGGF